MHLRWELAMDASCYYNMTYTASEYVITRIVIKWITAYNNDWIMFGNIEIIISLIMAPSVVFWTAIRQIFHIRHMFIGYNVDLDSYQW